MIVGLTVTKKGQKWPLPHEPGTDIFAPCECKLDCCYEVSNSATSEVNVGIRRGVRIYKYKFYIYNA